MCLWDKVGTLGQGSGKYLPTVVDFEAVSDPLLSTHYCLMVLNDIPFYSAG